MFHGDKMALDLPLTRRLGTSVRRRASGWLTTLPPIDDAAGVEVLHPPFCEIGEALIDVDLQRGKFLQLQGALQLPVAQRLAHHLAGRGVIAAGDRAAASERALFQV
jgi:hypothetical protein